LVSLFLIFLFCLAQSTLAQSSFKIIDKSKISKKRDEICQLLEVRVQLVAKKKGNENYPNVNLDLSICLLDNTCYIIFKNIIS
jgi:hypothetical protein